jgi:SRSO17 transposase
MAREMLQRAFAAEIPAAWVTMDEEYGQSKWLRV